ncbi:hypothetical protein GTW66_21615 [Streptomyces sp. SID5473]|uniref:Uncharacterized protein n=1 Tax=Streptomyces tsukubensis (strain DSM 42081 / NBRC 108919 / NRRL 18488 / 9993) TaxID=1114943 RepID=A0A7G3U9G9_STRT9|nr:hypothetical protein B7R87_26595 [Streptomyces tsukubensis]MYS66520.1 hypothetical protein [Streptomyces sp. SID5473]QKM66986.1 hypothetical protein STSU_007185 [Streptomyces tsukubensis NRRL18488]TAI41537.1 hypothetical protein EWI31_27265 [Streptomyces tsukubensis]
MTLVALATPRPTSSTRLGVECRYAPTADTSPKLAHLRRPEKAPGRPPSRRTTASTRAGWWLDQRDTNPADLPELLNAATESDRGTENPHRVGH